MTGAEWLERVFAPALVIGDPAAFPELLGALRALAACGVLTQEDVGRAEQQLRERLGWPGGAPSDPAGPSVAAPGSIALPTYDELDFVISPARPLVDVDGIMVVLVSVEFWTRGLFVRLGALRNATTDELDAEHEAWLMEREAAIRDDPDGVRPRSRHQPGERLIDVPLTVWDDIGTRYRSSSRSAGGTGTEWRAEWHFEPGVPPKASRLSVGVEGTDGTRHVGELVLPDPR